MAIALADAERSIHLNANTIWALGTRAHILEALGMTEAAFVDYDRAIETQT